MRPVHSSTQTAHIDHGVGREITMTLSSDEEDMAMNLLAMTNLYSRPDEATWRETSTNALDSHRAAGQTKPIEVTLPTADNPRFVVQDWGTGMSIDDIENIYSKFGRSTKRESDEETGMLGFGAKAPLAFCLSFTVEAVKHGRKTTAVVTKNERGNGIIKILAEADTDLPNGVKITVPIPPDRVQGFRTGASRFYAFWRGDVLVDGSPPDPALVVPDDATWLDPDIAVIGSNGRSYVVQGKVSYPYETQAGLPATVTWVPMGSVKFTPSREELQYGEVTDETLATIRDYVKTSLHRIVTARMAACANTYERIKTAYQIRREMPHRFQHPALNLTQTWYLKQDPDDEGEERRMWSYEHGERSSETYFNDRWVTDEKYSFITDFPFKRVSNLHLDMAQAAGLRAPLLFIPPDPGFPTDGFPGARWANIPEIPKEERTESYGQRSIFRSETRYQIWVGGRVEHLPVYDGPLPVLWTHDADTANAVSRKWDVAVGNILEAQVNRFTRLHPEVENWWDYVSRVAKRANQYLTKEDRRYMDSLPWERTLSNHFNHPENPLAKQVKDKTLRQHLGLTQSEHLVTLMGIGEAFGTHRIRPLMNEDDFALLMKVRGHISWNDRTPPGDGYLATHYPLLGYYRYFQSLTEVPAEEWIFYLNGKWAEVRKTLKAQEAQASDDDSDPDDNDADQAAA